jgi:hypothetical protein
VIHSDGLLPLRQFSTLAVKAKNNPSISILNFRDARVVKSSVGRAMTGFSNEDTPIVTDPPIEAFLKSRLAQNFSVRGFSVSDTAMWGMAGVIKLLWVYEDTHILTGETSRCQLELEFEIIYRETGEVRRKGLISSEAIGTNSVMDTTDSNGPALETCISYAVNKFIEDPENAALIGFEVGN